ncbi:agmatinase [bacterium]|nr:agmatinase [bacterium]
MNFHRLHFLESSDTLDSGSIAIIGLPYDATSSYRAGSRLGPNAIRVASAAIETWDPLLNRDLLNIAYTDLGDLETGPVSPQDFLKKSSKAISELPTNTTILGLGGEHSVTLPLFEHALKSHPDLHVIIFDAHTDLRESFHGTQYSHACITRNIFNLTGGNRIAMFGIRSGTEAEFNFANKHNMLKEFSLSSFKRILEAWGNVPLYISLDMDGFQPSEAPGTGVVEPGGFTWNELAPLLKALEGKKIVGADVVETSPDQDTTGRTQILAARVVRAFLLLMQNER